MWSVAQRLTGECPGARGWWTVPTGPTGRKFAGGDDEDEEGKRGPASSRKRVIKGNRVTLGDEKKEPKEDEEEAEAEESWTSSQSIVASSSIFSFSFLVAVLSGRVTVSGASLFWSW